MPRMLLSSSLKWKLVMEAGVCLPHSPPLGFLRDSCGLGFLPAGVAVAPGGGLFPPLRGILFFRGILGPPAVLT